MAQINQLSNQNMSLNGIQTNNMQQAPAQNVTLTQKPDSFESSTDNKAASADTDKQKSDKNKGLKIAAAILGVTAAAAGIVYAIKKHKAPKEAKKALSLEEFRKIGKFNKGNALIDGKGYTGTIEVPTKQGKTVIEYVNGALKGSERIETKISPADLRNGNLDNVSSVTKWKKTYDTKDGIKTIKTFATNELSGKPNIKSTTTIEPDKITVENAQKTRVAQKQSDGTWQVTLTNNKDDAFKL